jgi:hypothetical protein
MGLTESFEILERTGCRTSSMILSLIPNHTTLRDRLRRYDRWNGCFHLKQGVSRLFRVPSDYRLDPCFIWKHPFQRSYRFKYISCSSAVLQLEMRPRILLPPVRQQVRSRISKLWYTPPPTTALGLTKNYSSNNTLKFVSLL